MKLSLALPTLALVLLASTVAAQNEQPPRGLRDLNGYFPFAPVKTEADWAERRAEVERRVLLASGLWPMPEKTPLNAVVHGRVERDDYTIDRVFFESLPGHYVTGSLYLPKNPKKPMPGMLCPHGHWPDGRFMDRGAGTAQTKKEIEIGAEKLESGARSPLQARCVHLARMGFAVFHYDMLGYADSIQFPEHRHGSRKEGFVSAAADARLQTLLGLQTWNSVRALDFLLTVDGIDPSRIGCTGASGGGTQTMILSGFDKRVAASFPAVMVSTAMQGGCTCENSHHLRIGQGNMEIAALTAPRPLAITAANDWTKEIETKGLPDLRALYGLLGVPDRVSAHIATHFFHNYNLPSRLAMYAFFNKHFQLGLTGPIEERDFVVSSRAELTVWGDKHPAPTGEKVGAPHEVAICAWMTQQDKAKIDPLIAATDAAKREEIIGGAWETMIGRRVPAAKDARFEQERNEHSGAHSVVEGSAVYAASEASEQVPTLIYYPQDWKGDLVVWLSAEGRKSIAADGKPTPAAQKLLDAGLAIACPTLYLEGATENPKVVEKSPLKPGDFREFSGFTYGYNPTLLARRVHDAMTLTVALRGQTQRNVKRIFIAGTDGAAPVAAAAGAMLRKLTQGVALDLQGFTFASLSSPWDVNFVPGAVKYGDIKALLTLCAPQKVTEASGNEDVAAALIGY